MLLREVLAGAEVLRQLGPDTRITGVEYDSRRVVPGSLFVAMHGETTDGALYIESAIARGAAAVVTDSAAAFDAAAAGPLEASLAEVRHGRRALATLSANWFGHPERRLAITGVTGTNGKTTVAVLLEQLLRQAGRRCVLVGTIEYHVGDEVRPAPHTTPESRDLLALFAEGADKGASEAVMEVSSHALEQGRVWGIHYDVAIFTNLTRDHLDFHGDMESYLRAKQRLFDGTSGAPPPRVAVINNDDSAGARIRAAAKEAGSQVLSYGIDKGEFRAEAITLGLRGMRFRMVHPAGAVEIETALTGRVNVLNLLAASAAATARELTVEDVAAATSLLKPVPGRLETVSVSDREQEFAVVVDYAHTDDALARAIALARELTAQQGGRVITVFGCGGDRDRSKRPLMGRAAGEGSDLAIATSDNPRSEDPHSILQEIIPGLESAGARWSIEPDRAKAIEMAIHEAKAGDLVLVAGKGHEKTQTVGGQVLPFDDVAVARQALSERFGLAPGIKKESACD